MPSWTSAPPAPAHAQRGIIHRAATEDIYDLGRCDPGDILRPFVEHLWWVAWDRTGRDPVRSRTIPFPSMNVTVEQGSPGEVRHGHPLPASLVFGVPTRSFEVVLTGAGWVQGAKFRPGGWWAWSGQTASGLTDRAVPAGPVLSASDVPDPRSAVLDATGTEERVAALRATLETRAPDPDPDYLRLTALVDRMRDDATLTRVEQLPDLSGWSLRTLQRHFRQRVGVPAKWVLARFRIQEAALELERDPAVNLAELSARLGWHDQAHFTRDFRHTLGVTPARYAGGDQE